MSRKRRSREVKIGSVVIGGSNPIAVQSMTDTDTRDVARTVRQIRRLERAGCEIARVAVPDRQSADAIAAIREKVTIPVVADVHFDHRLALRALESGADKLRINPGNIGGPDRVRAVVSAAADRGTPIRIGVNAGSIERDILERYGFPTAEALAESVLRHVEMIESFGFHDLVLSAKSFDVPETVRANRILAAETDYPLHLGITEAGTLLSGAVRSAVGLGILLAERIGDTLRVSLADAPEREVEAAFGILKALGLRSRGVTVIACPTCGRTGIDVKTMARQVEKRLEGIEAPVTVAVMGCVVNGPGEARLADVGIAGGDGKGAVFEKGRVVATVPESELVDELVQRVEKLTTEREMKIRNPKSEIRNKQE